MDFQLIVNQLNESFQAKREKMELYLKKVKEMIIKFQEFDIEQILRV